MGVQKKKDILLGRNSNLRILESSLGITVGSTGAGGGLTSIAPQLLLRARIGLIGRARILCSLPIRFRE
jgi:hypothetical protein